MDITSLRTDLTAAQGEIATLKTKLAAAEADIALLDPAAVSALDIRLDVVEGNNALKLGPYVDVVTSTLNGVVGPNILFTRANVHVRSGSGNTRGLLNGLGNLIIGYNEAQPGVEYARTGSHNLVAGSGNYFSSYGGLIAGENNTLGANAPFATVTGGRLNTAAKQGATVSGGQRNTASGTFSSVSAGDDNEASGSFSTVSGGRSNTASNTNASVSGGYGNLAGNYFSSVSGGNSNTAGGQYSSVSGGMSNYAAGNYSTVSGGAGQIAYDPYSWAP